MDPAPCAVPVGPPRAASPGARLHVRTGQLAAGVVHELSTPTQFISDNLHFVTSVLPSIGREAGESEDAADTNELVLDACSALSDSLDGVADLRHTLDAFRWFATPARTNSSGSDLETTLRQTLRVTRSAWKYVATIDYRPADHLDPVACGPDELKLALSGALLGVFGLLSARADAQSPAALQIATAAVDIGAEVRCHVPFDAQLGDDDLVRASAEWLEVGRVSLEPRGDGVDLVWSIAANVHIL